MRGGGKGKAGGQWDQVDTLKQQTATTRKVSHTGTWHVYRATAEVSIAGRLTEASEPRTWAARSVTTTTSTSSFLTRT